MLFRSNGYSQYKQTGSLKSINWKDVGKSALKGAVVGAVGGLVGGAVAAVATAAVGTAAIGGGVTLTLAQSIGVGAMSSMAGGVASRYVGSRWDGNSVRTSASVAFNPWAMMFDGLLGGAFGGLTHSSQPQYPFGKPPQTKGEYNTAKAWLEKFQKYCDEHGLAKTGKQTVKDPVEIPVDKFAKQAKQELNEVTNTISSSKPNNTEIVWPNKPHTNGTSGHWETIQNKATDLANSGEYSKIYVNKGISNEIPGATPNRRPDIMAVKPNGTIDQFEVPSKTDSVAKLIDRMLDNKNIIGDRAGSIEIVPIK